MVVIILASVIALAGNFSATMSMKVTRTPSESVTTAISYDPSDRRPQLECQTASGGACRFIVTDGPRRKQLMIRQGNHFTLRDVSPAARVCAGGRNPIPNCTWTPVNPTG